MGGRDTLNNSAKKQLTFSDMKNGDAQRSKSLTKQYDDIINIYERFRENKINIILSSSSCRKNNGEYNKRLRVTFKVVLVEPKVFFAPRRDLRKCFRV